MVNQGFTTQQKQELAELLKLQNQEMVGLLKEQKQEIVAELDPYFTAIKQDFNHNDDQLEEIKEGQADIQGQLSSIQNRQSEELASIDRHDTEIGVLKTKLGVL